MQHAIQHTIYLSYTHTLAQLYKFDIFHILLKINSYHIPTENIYIYVYTFLSLYLISLLHCYILFHLNMYRIALGRIVRLGLAAKDEANKQTHLEYLYINLTRVCIFLSVVKTQIDIFLFLH